MYARGTLTLFLKKITIFVKGVSEKMVLKKSLKFLFSPHFLGMFTNFFSLHLVTRYKTEKLVENL